MYLYMVMKLSVIQIPGPKVVTAFMCVMHVCKKYMYLLAHERYSFIHSYFLLLGSHHIRWW